jgi:hypothetical protein
MKERPLFAKEAFAKRVRFWEMGQGEVGPLFHPRQPGGRSFYSAEDLVLADDDDPSHRAHKEIWVSPKLVIEIREHCLSAKA